MELTRRLATALLAAALASAAPSALCAQGATDPRATQALIREADSLFDAAQHEAALARYEAALRSDSSASRALIRVAQLRSWRNEFHTAIRLLRRYVVLEPRDADGHAALARVLAWNGDLIESESRWSELSQQHPDNADILVGLAQVRRWRGNPRGARTALNEALRLNPNHVDGLEQRRWLSADLDPVAGVTVIATHDSDDNDAFAVVVNGGFALPVGQRLEATALVRHATLGSLDGNAASAFVRWSVATRGEKLRALVGAGVISLSASALPGGSAPDATLAYGSAGIVARVGTRVFAGAAVSRSPLDEVVGSIRTSVVLDAGDIEASIQLPHRVTVGAAAQRASVVRGEDGANDRWGASGSIGWTHHRNIALAIRSRAFGHHRVATDGYFSPLRFQLSEFVLGWHSDESTGWQSGVDLTAGAQRMRLANGAEPSTREAWSATALAGYRWRPGVESNIKATVANVASPATVNGSGEYRYSALTATVRWLF